MSWANKNNIAPEKTKTLHCAVYTRKSTDENLNSDFNSLDSQREYCQAFIKSREPEGWKVCPIEYNDPGFSGGNMDRPGLKKLIADARNGKFQVVVCYKYDRLSRNTRDFLHILDIFDRNGVAFVSVTQPIDTTSSIGRLMRSILMDFAQFEREMIAERTRDKMAAMARKGKRTGGYPIIGYDINYEKKCLEVNTEESVQVQEMFTEYLKTRSLSETAKAMNAKGCRMKAWITQQGTPKGGQKFNKANLWYLLRNPLYIGKIRHKEETYDGEHPAIISEDIFHEVQKTFERNGDGKVRKSIKNRSHTFLLKGLLRCTCCKTAMTPSSCLPRKQSRFYYYKCLSVSKLDKTACRVRSVPAKAIEDFVTARLKQLSANTKLVDKIIRQSRLLTGKDMPAKREEKQQLAVRLGKVSLEANNLVAVLAQEGPDSQSRTFIAEKLAELKAQRDELEAKSALLNSEIEQMENMELDTNIVQAGLKNFLALFDKLNGGEKAEILSLLIKQVEFNGTAQKVAIHLRPLPKVWGDTEAMYGVFYNRKTWGG